jgi:hypothetical protein
VIDIGPSSSGLVSLIKEALPLNRQHEAVSYPSADERASTPSTRSTPSLGMRDAAS